MTELDRPKMTHNEMIDTLKGLVFGTFDRTTAREREALDEAIKVLEQEPFINKPCVSSGVCEHDKNKVLDKIRAEIESCREDEEPHLCDYRYHRNEGLDMALNIIDNYKAGSEDKECR